MAKKNAAASKGLPAIEGHNIIGTAVKITKAGDGLSKAIGIDNNVFHFDDVVHVVLECKMANLSFPQAKDADGRIRVHILEAGRATFVSADLVEAVLNEQDRRLEESAGLQHLFDENGDPIDSTPPPTEEPTT